MKYTFFIVVMAWWYFSIPNANSTEVWAKGSECTELEQPIIRITKHKRLRYYPQNRYENNKNLDHVKLLVLDELEKNYPEHANVVIKKMHMYRQPMTEAFYGKYVNRYEFGAEFMPVESCSDGLKVDRGNLAILTVVSLGVPSIKLNYDLAAASKRRSTNVVSNQHAQLKINTIAPEQVMMTENSILGLKIGSSFSDFMTQVGRPSVYWPLTKGKTIAMVGRKLALFFKNEQLVGYQYAHHLLPLTLSNEVEFFEQQNQVDLKLQNQTVSLSEPLSQGLKKQAMEAGMHLDLVRYKKSTHEYLEKIAGIAVGDVFTDTMPESLSCLPMDNKEVDVINYHTIRFVDQKLKTKYLTGCNQIVELWNEKQYSRVQLIEPLPNHNVELAAFETLLEKQKPWRFKQWHYQSDLASLPELQKLDVVNDIAKFESSRWFGHFEIADEKLVAAKLISQ
ncbi:hypothetical protein NI389_09555 [Pseudoalteromonas xiamenensis]|uniref:hypothetical protein n=1 Tax=Pseudoalteromonas xiamenensis TaxID=882626 RepID=UPI0027E58C8A|nr:hypothetical protein [Pseudoalteromonas xiamenensis]WMN58509.1 hypothetical protein NI389_09555 [Pseudoalteromonas xiamenensis]